MSDLIQNTQYNAPGTQPSPIADFSGIAKAVQERTQQTSSATVNSALNAHFNPTVASSIFGSTPTAPMNAPDSTGNAVGPGGVADYGVPVVPAGPEGATPPSYERFLTPPASATDWSLPSGSGTPTAWPASEQGTPGSQYVTTPADTSAVLHNWPTDLGGGQYVIDPTQPGKMIKSGRVLMNNALNPGATKSILGGLSPKLYQIDHIIPLELGGADTLANLEIYTNSENAEKQRVQAVPLTLLINGKISLSQARAMAFSWKTQDANGLPSADDVTNKLGGMVPLDVAEKQAQKWQNNPGNDNYWKDFGEAFKENMGNFGSGWLPTPVREFAKGLVGGGTAGIVPGTGPSAGEGAVGTISNILGNVAGTLTGLGLLTKGVGLGVEGVKVALGIKNSVAIADDALITSGLTTDIGNVSSAASQARMLTLKKMASSAGLLSLWGQLGLTGKEATGQDAVSFKNHVNTFLSDVAYGGLLGSTGQTVKGYATVGLGSTALSLIEGQDITTALQNGAIMTALHGMAYEKGVKIDPKAQIGTDEAYKMSATAFNQYLGDDVMPTVKKGQTVPPILKIAPETIDKLKSDYQTAHPNDTRFDNVQNTDSASAVKIMGRNARSSFMSSVVKADGTIPQENIKGELTRLTVSENQLNNQTLPPAERQQKEWADLTSMGQQLRPQVTSAQLRPGIDATTLLNNTPFNFPDQQYENPDGTTFLTGNVPTTGYGSNIDTNAKQNVNDYYNQPYNFSDKLFIVKDPETAKVMRLVAQEQIANGKIPNVGNPDDALRVFVKSKTPDGGDIKPVGYMPRQQSFDAKENNLNKTYYEITNRLRRTIETAKDPDTIKSRLNKDKAVINIDDQTAQRLFDNRKTLKSMSDEDLYAILKPKNAFEKYDSSLNNSAISQEMDKHGINVLVVNADKVMPTGGPGARANPTNPYISLNLNEQDWLRSIAMKNGYPDETTPETAQGSTPVKQGIRNIISKIKSQNMAKTSGNILEKIASPEPTNVPPIDMVQNTAPEPTTPEPAKTTGLTKAEIKSLKKQGFTDDAIAKINSKPIVTKPVFETYNPNEEETTSQTAPGTPVLPQITPPEAVKPTETTNTPTVVPNTPQTTINAKTDITQEFFNDMVDRIENIKPDLSSPENHEKSLMSAVDGFKRKNPGLPDNEFKAAMSEAKGRAKAYVQDFIDSTYQGTKRFGTDDPYARVQTSDNKNVLIRRYNELNARNKEVTLRPFEKTEMADLKTKIQKYVELDKQSNDIKTKANDLQRPLTDDEKSKLQDLNQKKFTLTQDYRGQKDASLVLANKFGLDLQPPNAAGLRYLKLDRYGNPVFSDEFKKTNNVGNQSPVDFWGSTLGNEMKVYRSTLSTASNEWGTGIDEMKKSSSPYAKGFAGAIDEALKAKYDVKDPQTGETRHSWKDSWKANSALKNLGNWFDLSNEEGYANSQPFKRTAAITAGRDYSDVRKNVATVDAETKKASEQAKENRLNLLSTGKAPELPGGMRIKDPNQIGDVSEDLTPFDMMTNGLLTTEVRNKLVDQYNNLRKEVGINSADPKSNAKEEMKNLFTTIKKMSVNIPEEVKKWKLGSKIILKNGGEPTAEQGIKDGMRIASSIFKNKKTPGYVQYENVRNNVLKQLGGKGGPYNGKGGLFTDAWNNMKSYFGPVTYASDYDPSVLTSKKSNDINIPNFLKAIRTNETSTVKGDPYNSFQYSGKKAYGDALGAYRVTESDLKTHAPRYLGKSVTRQEFLSSPQMQDTYMTNRANYLNQQGYTPQQIADIHNQGMTNESSPGSTIYQNPSYVNSFNTTYNGPLSDVGTVSK